MQPDEIEMSSQEMIQVGNNEIVYQEPIIQTGRVSSSTQNSVSEYENEQIFEESPGKKGAKKKSDSQEDSMDFQTFGHFEIDSHQDK